MILQHIDVDHERLRMTDKLLKYSIEELFISGISDRS